MPSKQANMQSIRAIIGSSFESVAFHRSECESIVDYMFENADYSDLTAGQILPTFIEGWSTQTSEGNNPTVDNVNNILKQLTDMSVNQSDNAVSNVSVPDQSVSVSDSQAISLASFIRAIDPKFSELIQSVTRTSTGFVVEFKQ